MLDSNMKPETLAAQALGWVDPTTKEIVGQIHTSTTYIRDADNQYRNGRVYARDHNPTFEQAESVLNALEGGGQTLLFASGMAAATAVFQALSPGDHVIAPKVMYWALRNWLKTFAVRWGLSVDFVDMDSLDAVRAAIRPGKTKLVWIETPANPTWIVTDIAGVASIAHEAGALLAVDSTCATPVLTRPIEFGADIVMHAATKYLNGHSDVVAGTLTCSPALATAEMWTRVRAVRGQIGGIAGPFEAWLLTRGMRTLFPRVRTACANAQRVAEHFAAHAGVVEVLYPGLPGFAGHAVAARQMQGGFGGMLSIRIKGGEAAAIAVAANTQLWKRATSLGGVESLIEHRSSVEGEGSPAPVDMLRLSAGIESADDLIADLEQAIASAR
ncbi:MAG: trans-sulfuration enzyme family protein [Burkholderiales bacterium]|jgi:cystathionine gamma-synthase|nr:aminotransferase class I/II-fold pyridoxal phosphate-dependent enzyme [Nitrosomonadaceae bacterium]